MTSAANCTDTAHIRYSIPEDVDWVGPRLREADKAEVLATSGRDPVECLRESMLISAPALTLVATSGHPMAMCGVAPTEDPMVGSCWLLGTDELVHPLHRKRFILEAPQWFDALNVRYPLLFNYVDARNTAHIRWLKFAGAVFLRRVEEYGVERLPFYEFVRVRKYV